MIWITILTTFIALFAYALALSYLAQTAAAMLSVYFQDGIFTKVTTGVVITRALVTALLVLVGLVFTVLSVSLYSEVMA